MDVGVVGSSRLLLLAEVRALCDVVRELMHFTEEEGAKAWAAPRRKSRERIRFIMVMVSVCDDDWKGGGDCYERGCIVL